MKSNLGFINVFSRYLYIVAVVLGFVCCQPMLNKTAITFQMSGPTVYTPDTGGATKNGYKLRIGFSHYQWIAVQFVMNNNKNDLLVVQLDEFYTTGANQFHTGHQVKVDDYYISSDSVLEDQIIENDISTINYVDTKDYYLDMVRYSGSNSGEDWNGAAYKYSLTEICFYTNENLFDPNQLKNGISACYSFEIDNYVSSFKGEKLKDFYINGYKTQINGWIDGPYVSANLYLYHLVPLFSYTQKPSVAVQIGTTTNQAGQDFYVYSPVSSETGDYFGSTNTNMSKDNTIAGGFQNGRLLVQYWNADPAEQIAEYPYTTIRINFNRNISSHDLYDKQLKSTLIFCLYLYTEGTINSELTDKGCEITQLPQLYPKMSMPIKPAFEFNQMSCIMLLMLFCSIGIFNSFI